MNMWLNNIEAFIKQHIFKDLTFGFQQFWLVTLYIKADVTEKFHQQNISSKTFKAFYLTA